MEEGQGSGGEGNVFSSYLSICELRKGPGKFLIGVLQRRRYHTKTVRPNLRFMIDILQAKYAGQISYLVGPRLHAFHAPLPPFTSSPLHPSFSLLFPCLFLDVGHLNTAMGLGSTLSSPAVSETEPQRKLNLVHFRCDDIRWTSILHIFLGIN